MVSTGRGFRAAYGLDICASSTRRSCVTFADGHHAHGLQPLVHDSSSGRGTSPAARRNGRVGLTLESSVLLCDDRFEFCCVLTQRVSQPFVAAGEDANCE